MKLTNRIHLYSSALFAALLIIMNLSIYFTFSSVSINNELERIKSETINVAANIQQSSDSVRSEDLLRAYVPVTGMIRLTTQGKEEPSLSVTSSSEQKLKNYETDYYNQLHVEKVTYQGNTYVLVSNPVIWSDGTVVNIQTVVSLEQLEETLAVLRLVLVAVTAIALIPVILSSRLLSNLITTPIISIINTMKEIQSSNKFKRIKLESHSKDELQEMGETFNRMIELLENNYKKQESFISSASHELNTPLTVIESYASLLKRRGQENPTIFNESIEAIHSEAIRMKEMTQQLLLLARNDAHWDIHIEDVSLNDFLQEIVSVFEKAYQREIDFKTEKFITVMTDKNKLKQLVFIFLDNARKYSEEKIIVSVSESTDLISIQISDRGIGIPKEDIQRVFDRFYRVDKARSRKIGGSGLGLSLAKEIAEAIGVKVDLESIEGIGTTVTLLLERRTD